MAGYLMWDGSTFVHWPPLRSVADAGPVEEGEGDEDGNECADEASAEEDDAQEGEA